MFKRELKFNSPNILQDLQNNAYSATYNFATPEMYGAVGDGIEDDTKAIQECINANNKIKLSKQYLITRPILIDAAEQEYDESQNTYRDVYTRYGKISKIIEGEGTIVLDSNIDGMQIALSGTVVSGISFQLSRKLLNRYSYSVHTLGTELVDAYCNNCSISVYAVNGTTSREINMESSTFDDFRILQGSIPTEIDAKQIQITTSDSVNYFVDISLLRNDVFTIVIHTGADRYGYLLGNTLVYDVNKEDENYAARFNDKITCIAYDARKWNKEYFDYNYNKSVLSIVSEYRNQTQNCLVENVRIVPSKEENNFNTWRFFGNAIELKADNSGYKADPGISYDSWEQAYIYNCVFRDCCVYAFRTCMKSTQIVSKGLNTKGNPYIGLGINCNTFDVNSWFCDCYFDGETWGSEFSGSYQSTKNRTYKDSFVFENFQGRFNTIRNYFMDIAWDRYTTENITNAGIKNTELEDTVDNKLYDFAFQQLIDESTCGKYNTFTSFTPPYAIRNYTGKCKYNFVENGELHLDRRTNGFISPGTSFTRIAPANNALPQCVNQIYLNSGFAGVKCDSKRYTAARLPIVYENSYGINAYVKHTNTNLNYIVPDCLKVGYNYMSWSWTEKQQKLYNNDDRARNSIRLQREIEDVPALQLGRATDVEGNVSNINALMMYVGIPNAQNKRFQANHNVTEDTYIRIEVQSGEHLVSLLPEASAYYYGAYYGEDNTTNTFKQLHTKEWTSTEVLDTTLTRNYTDDKGVSTTTSESGLFLKLPREFRGWLLIPYNSFDVNSTGDTIDIDEIHVRFGQVGIQFVGSTNYTTVSNICKVEDVIGVESNGLQLYFEDSNNEAVHLLKGSNPPMITGIRQNSETGQTETFDLPLLELAQVKIDLPYISPTSIDPGVSVTFAKELCSDTVKSRNITLSAIREYRVEYTFQPGKENETDSPPVENKEVYVYTSDLFSARTCVQEWFKQVYTSNKQDITDDNNKRYGTVEINYDEEDNECIFVTPGSAGFYSNIARNTISETQIQGTDKQTTQQIDIVVDFDTNSETLMDSIFLEYFWESTESDAEGNIMTKAYSPDFQCKLTVLDPAGDLNPPFDTEVLSDDNNTNIVTFIPRRYRNNPVRSATITFNIDTDTFVLKRISAIARDATDGSY